MPSAPKSDPRGPSKRRFEEPNLPSEAGTGLVAPLALDQEQGDHETDDHDEHETNE